MPKVLALIDSYRVNGPCRGLMQLVQHAGPRGVDITLGSFLPRGVESTEMIEAAQARGFSVVPIRQTMRFDPAAILRVRQAIRDGRYDVLQSHGYKPGVISWAIKNATGLPWVAVMHGHTRENRAIAFYNKLDLWTAGYADRVVAVSAETSRYLVARGIPRDRIRVIPNAIDPSHYQAGGNCQSFRQRIGIGDGKLVVGVIGRLSPEKGVISFVKTFARVVRAMPEAVAVIVGEGPQESCIKDLTSQYDLQKNVVICEYQRDISSVYASIDLVVIPSLSEGLPNVLLEAFLHRKPVVSTRVGGIPEVMSGELSDWLVAPNDEQALAEKITQMLSSSAARQHVAGLGAEIVLRKFTPAERAARFLDLYNDVLSENRRRVEEVALAIDDKDGCNASR